MSDVKEIKVNENEVKEKPVKAKKVKTSVSDKAFNTILTIIATIVLLIVLYPMIYVVSSSFSSGNAVSSGRVYLWPVEFSTIGYEWALNNEMVWTGYANSIFYTLSATVIHLFMTICGAYPLSRKNYQAKGFIQKYFTFYLITYCHRCQFLVYYVLYEKHNTSLCQPQKYADLADGAVYGGFGSGPRCFSRFERVRDRR